MMLNSICEPLPIYSPRKEFCIKRARQVLKRLEELNVDPLIPVPIEDVVSMCGYRILWLTTMPNELSGIVNRHTKLVGINAHHSRTRQRFSIAHELGHIILRHPAESECTDSAIWTFNKEADLFAAELLIPTDDLLNLVHEKNFHELKNRYRVSGEALKLKLDLLEGVETDSPAPTIK